MNQHDHDDDGHGTPGGAGSAAGAGGMELHLRIRVETGRREEFLAFLREATVYYESPGGIAIRLLEDERDDHRFIEVVAYATREAYERDRERVERDPVMRGYLERWRALLAEGPLVEVYGVRG
ncbi:MAG: putative quinol monooxygenase [Phycisphaerales bacterium]